MTDLPMPDLQQGDLQQADIRQAALRQTAPPQDAPLDDPLLHAARWHAQGEAVALATVTTTWGSSPRPAGSRMAISANGRIAGSVSSGCVEGDVVEAALETIRDGQPRLLSYGVSDDSAWSVGLTCGGTISVFVERVADGDAR